MKKTFNEKTINKLSFPDFNIETMEFLPAQKKVLIKIEGALSDDEENILGRGFLLFHSWKDISIRSFNYELNEWIDLNQSSADNLKDLCEVKTSDSTITLCGFGKMNGWWTEWTFIDSKLIAEFEL